MDTHEELKVWLRAYINAKSQTGLDVLDTQYDSGGFDVYVKLKDKEQFFLIKSNFDIKSIEKAIPFDKPTYLVVPNRHEVLGEVLSHWDTLVGYPKLCILFVNPRAPYERKWQLYPATHDRLIGRKNLKSALLSLFSQVPEYINK